MYRVKDLPCTEKPRERLIDKGAESLSDSELLAIVLRSGYKDMNVFDISRNLVNEYGLKKLFELQFASLKKIKGIGNSKACEILAISEIGRRIKNGSNDSAYINYPKDAVALCAELQSKDKEHLIGLYLNTRHKVIEKVLLSIGNLDSSIVDPKEIYKHALRLNAHGVILLHNHPSGDHRPSDEDINITKLIKRAGLLLNVKLIDHIIIGAEGFSSIKDILRDEN